MNANELRAKIESLKEELEQTQDAYQDAVAMEAGVTLHKSLVKSNDGGIYRVIRVIRHVGEDNFVSIEGHKRLKDGTFSGRVTYAGILGHNGCEILQ
jgi:hypothetical protein